MTWSFTQVIYGEKNRTVTIFTIYIDDKTKIFAQLVLSNQISFDRGRGEGVKGEIALSVRKFAKLLLFSEFTLILIK